MNKSLQKQLETRKGNADITRIRENLEKERLEYDKQDVVYTEEQKEKKPSIVKPENDGLEDTKRRRKITRDTFSDEKGKRLSVDLPETVFKAVGVYCANEGVTRADLTFDLFIKHLIKEGYLK